MAHKHPKKATHAAFIGIPRSVADSPAFISLTPIERALWLDLRRQFNGRNNGDICKADGVLTHYGWAHTTIHKCLKVLIARGLIVETRKGGIASMSRIPSLFAFTDMAINANPAKQIAGAMASLAYRDYKPQPKEKRARKKVKVHAMNAKIHAVNLFRVSA